MKAKIKTKTKTNKTDFVVIIEQGMFQPQIDPEFVFDIEDVPGALECIYILFM